MKFEWRKKEKNLYLPKEKVEVLEVPKQKFFMINGVGNPNGAEFSERIEVLYSLAYAVRMMPKSGYTPEGYFEYTVYPLEGVWDLTEEGKTLANLDKEKLVYTIMIRQPEFVTEKIFERAVENVRKKKSLRLLDTAKFREMEDSMSIQMMHIGSFDDEYKTFDVMNKYCIENNLKIIKDDFHHREIYISDIRKVESSKLKTVLRYRVSK